MALVRLSTALTLTFQYMRIVTEFRRQSALCTPFSVSISWRLPGQYALFVSPLHRGCQARQLHVLVTRPSLRHSHLTPRLYCKAGISEPDSMRSWLVHFPFLGGAWV